jgi:NADPH:quinone reductase-like Zn-dependent oxidoreductase
MAGDGRLERCRLNAEKCLELAQTFNDQERKRIMLRMANAWLTLAEQHLKNSETVLMHADDG